MSEDDLQRLDRVFELMSEPEIDWEALYELLDPDIVWEVRSDFPDASVYAGYDGLRRLSDAFDHVVERTWYRPVEYIQTGATSSYRSAGADAARAARPPSRNVRRPGS
jgi:hypothetical protein